MHHESHLYMRGKVWLAKSLVFVYASDLGAGSRWPGGQGVALHADGALICVAGCVAMTHCVGRVAGVVSSVALMCWLYGRSNVVWLE